MNQTEYLEFHADWCKKMHQIALAKNTDYCKGSADAFSNLKASEYFGITSTEVAIMSRLLDKVSRTCSFIQRNQFAVEDEKLVDTLQDLCNYAILLAAYIESKTASDF